MCFAVFEASLFISTRLYVNVQSFFDESAWFIKTVLFKANVFGLSRVLLVLRLAYLLDNFVYIQGQNWLIFLIETQNTMNSVIGLLKY